MDRVATTAQPVNDMQVPQPVKIGVGRSGNPLGKGGERGGVAEGRAQISGFAAQNLRDGRGLRGIETLARHGDTQAAENLAIAQKDRGGETDGTADLFTERHRIALFPDVSQ